MLDQQLLEHARTVWREFAERCADRREQRRQAMDGYFKNFMEDLLNYPLVRPWRESLDLFQEHYFQQPGVGMRLTPESYDRVAALIERYVNDPRSGAYGPIQPDATGIPPKVLVGVAGATTAEKPSPLQVSTPRLTAATKPAQPAPSWPALSEEDRERNRKGVGIPWWWPIQPTGPFDDDWERRFEELGRQSKDLLLAVYQELAATGKLAKALEDQEGADLTPLEEQSPKAQEAFDAYQYSVVQFRRKWVAYQYETQSIGIHVFALVERIDAALPTRIEGLKSHFDRELADAARQSVKAGRIALSRAEGAYRETRFVDWTVTAVEIVTILGGIRAAAIKVAAKALAEGATESAARTLAVKYAVKQLVVQSAVATGAQAVIPPILSAAGLNEDEIRAGLAIMQALQTLVALKTLKVGAAAPEGLPETSPPELDGPANRPPKSKPPDAVLPNTDDTTTIIKQGVGEESVKPSPALAIPLLEDGPGVWVKPKAMPPRARAYQTQITGREEEYLLGGVRFDGYRDGVLLEAKGPGYGNFVTGEDFRKWFTGVDEIFAQTKRQLDAAGGVPIVWHVAEPELATALEKAFKGKGVPIQILHSPAK